MPVVHREMNVESSEAAPASVLVAGGSNACMIYRVGFTKCALPDMLHICGSVSEGAGRVLCICCGKGSKPLEIQLSEGRYEGRVQQG